MPQIQMNSLKSRAMNCGPLLEMKRARGFRKTAPVHVEKSYPECSPASYSLPLHALQGAIRIDAKRRVGHLLIAMLQPSTTPFSGASDECAFRSTGDSFA